MADPSSSQPSAEPPRRYWRFSLRALLVFFTLACVGVWYWYRVPYREEVVHPDRPPWGGMGLFAENQQVYVASREVRRFRRVLRGDPIREGETEYFNKDGRRLGEENWREGKLHGRFMRWYPSGKVHEQGTYDLGAKTGVWEQFDASGNLVLRTPYDADWPHGEAQWFAGGKVTRTVHYDRGEVTQIDGRDVDDPLGRALREGRLDNDRIAEMLPIGAPSETPNNAPSSSIAEVANFISNVYKVNVAVDSRALFQAGKAEDLTIRFPEDKLITAHLMFILICDPHDLAATYRFGMIWITTKDDAKTWIDRTGVSEVLASAPADVLQDSRQRIAAAWLKPVLFDFLDTPCSDLARYLANTYQVPLECDEKLNFMPVTSRLHGINLQNALSTLCDQHHLRIRWKDAGTIVIEPQEETSRTQARRAGMQ